MNGGGGRKAEALPVTGAFFMENLDGAITSPAAPDMAASFTVRPTGTGAATTARLVTPAAAAPTGSSPGRPI
ncbi:hypothetical protein ACH4TV_43400 [Streptomyces sp. NPDC020898]|uniref:hypothetical protein n=1 Tax=Streptomyces sp. NPDC020898 TaxID=3365101 RepID=UPI0037927806